MKSKSKPVIYLHIGMNKTGTTAIQRHFSENREFYKGHGLLYPETAHVAGAHYGLSSSLGFQHGSFPREWVIALGAIKEGVDRELSEADIHSVIFSSEFFVLNKPVNEVKKFFQGYSVKVVVYLRRHDHWWLSAYAQAVKTKALPPWSRKVLGFINFNKKNNPAFGSYRVLVDRWAEHFGKENIIVRPYEAQQNSPDIVSDLLAAIGFSCSSPDKPMLTKRDNGSLSAFELSLIDTFQRAKIEDKQRQQLVAYVAGGAVKPLVGGGSSSLMRPRLRKKLIEENLEDYRYIAREYLSRADGQLFHEPLPAPDPSWEAPPNPTATQVVEVVLATLSGKPQS